MVSIPYIKIFYLLIIILVMFIINIILSKRKINISYRYYINGISLIVIALIINYASNIIEGILTLKYLSVKLYIITLIIINLIAIYTLKNKLSIGNKICNYSLAISSNLILILNIMLIIFTRLEILDSSFIKYALLLTNVSLIIFVAYLLIISIIYIIKNLTKKKRIKDIPVEDITIKSNILTNDELLALSDKDNFTINGVECSIIFEDSIPENIINNYHILLNDINAKLVNGYTLEENKLLKSICTKLNTNNLNDINLNNLSILNIIDADEYNLLKQILGE